MTKDFSVYVLDPLEDFLSKNGQSQPAGGVAVGMGPLSGVLSPLSRDETLVTGTMVDCGTGESALEVVMSLRHVSYTVHPTPSKYLYLRSWLLHWLTLVQWLLCQFLTTNPLLRDVRNQLRMDRSSRQNHFHRLTSKFSASKNVKSRKNRRNTLRDRVYLGKRIHLMRHERILCQHRTLVRHGGSTR